MATMDLWFGNAGLFVRLGAMPACSAAGAPSTTSRTPSWRTSSSVFSVPLYVLMVLPVAASSAVNGESSPSGV
jgi:hypothetical protein